MADPLTIISGGIAALSGAINLGRSLFGQPEFPLTADDVNREIDQQLNRALAQTASDTRRRLIGAGQEGSGTINSTIQDQQARIRTFFEEQRTKALNMLAQAQYGRDVNAFNQLTQTLGDLSSTGLSTALLTSGVLNRSNAPGQTPGVTPNLNTFVGDQIRQSNFGFPQPLQPAGLSPLPRPQFNTPLQFAR